MCPPSLPSIWHGKAGRRSHFSRLWGQTVPRHENNSQIIQEVVRGVRTQTGATSDPVTGQRSGSSFSFLICHQSNTKTAPEWNHLEILVIFFMFYFPWELNFIIFSNCTNTSHLKSCTHNIQRLRCFSPLFQKRDQIRKFFFH